MRWFGDLDAPALFSLCAGGVMALNTLTGGASNLHLRLLGAALWAGLGALFAFGKWPLERHGDRFWVWLRRAIEYWLRPRIGSVFGPVRRLRKRKSKRSMD